MRLNSEPWELEKMCLTLFLLSVVSPKRAVLAVCEERIASLVA
jgi:hypothetical protein